MRFVGSSAHLEWKMNEFAFYRLPDRFESVMSNCNKVGLSILEILDQTAEVRASSHMIQCSLIEEDVASCGATYNTLGVKEML